MSSPIHSDSPADDLIAPAPPILGSAELRERASIEIERALRYRRSLGVLVIDLGPHAMDDPSIASAACSVFRRVDVVGFENDDELIALLPETDDAVAVPAYRLLEALRSSAPRARAGFARCPHDGCDADMLLNAARRAAKSNEAGNVSAVASAARARGIGDAVVLAVDPAMSRILSLVERLAASDIPVVIGGETGTGKEVVARALHEWSKRRAAPMVSINCAAVPEPLLESELFGHERGAFSGAITAKMGLLESATGGTVFLDEVGECAPAAQAKLLRVLETKRVCRLGAITERAIDVRIVAATNRSLEQEVEARRFRQDLFFRLSAASILLPPLRDRALDLAPLARLFLEEACAREKRAPLSIAGDAMQRLAAHAWPGNVRELKNVMKFLAATAAGPTIEIGDLPEGFLQASGAFPIAEVRAVTPAPPVEARRVFRNLYDEIRELERTRITEALEETGGVRVRAAELIGIPLRTLVTKIKEYGLADAGGPRRARAGGSRAEG